MRDIKKRIKNKRATKYLEEIMSGESVICNPTPLEIPGFRKVIATSMVNYHVYDGKAISYFTFKKGRVSGEFTKEGRRYFVTYDGGVK